MYIDDASVSGMLYAATIRSPIAKGRFFGITPPKMGNAYTLITAADIPGKNQLDDMQVPILAGDTISYIGEPIALLVGPDITNLEIYVKDCTATVDYENPVFSPAEGTVPDQDGIYFKREYSTGSTEKAFASAYAVVSGEYTTGIQEHWYSEAHGALARFTGNKLTVHTPSQWLYHVRRSIAGMLKLDDSLINIEQTSIGIHLDGKLWYPSLISCQAALASHIVKKPVKLMLTREEDFRYSPKRNKSVIKLQSAIGEKGEVLATEISVSANLGGQGIFSEEIIDHTSLGSLGIYRLGKINLNAAAYKTNIPPQGPFGGFGLSQGFFALERHVSHIAEFLETDPAEWRRQNRYRKGDNLAIGIALKEQPPVSELMDRAAKMGDYSRKWASCELLRRERRSLPWSFTAETLRGIGIAASYQGSGFLYTGNDKGSYSLELCLEKENLLKIKTSIPLFTENQMKIWKGIAYEVLGIEAAGVKVILGAPDSGPASLSRNITSLTRLFAKCCSILKKKRQKDALPIIVSQNIKPDRINPWNQETAGTGKTADANAFNRPGWAVAVVEAEIDPITFLPFVHGIWLAVDGGRIISPDSAKRALKRSVIDALGWASREQLVYAEGQIPNSIIHNYDIQAPEEIPPIAIEFLPNNASSPRGIGDLPFSCIPAAYVQAVSQAMDHHYNKIPISAKDIWEVGLVKKNEARTLEAEGQNPEDQEENIA